MYETLMKDLEEFYTEAWRWVVNGPRLEHWVKAFFPSHVRSDMLCNNLCESFNTFILEVRDKPILSIVEGIREMVMKRIQIRRCWIMKQPSHPCTPIIRKKLEEQVYYSRNWKPLWNGVDSYQVMGTHNEQYVVDLKRNTCSCQLWYLTGIPCVHSIVALHKQDTDPHDLVDPYYSTESFCKLYDNILFPINGKKMWPKGEGVILDPPRAHK